MQPCMASELAEELLVRDWLGEHRERVLDRGVVLLLTARTQTHTHTHARTDTHTHTHACASTPGTRYDVRIPQGAPNPS